MSQLIDKDIKFDRYGDISFIGNDLDLIGEYRDILYQNVIDRLITNFNDYELYPSFGANLSSFKGKNVLFDLEEAIEKRVVKCLTRDNFLFIQQVTVVAIRNVDNIMIRIAIQTVNQQIPILEEFRVDAVYNTSSGMFHATN